MDDLVTTVIDSSLITAPPPDGIDLLNPAATKIIALPDGIDLLNPVVTEITAIYGTNGNDRIENPAGGSNIIFGLAGNDLLYGRNGNDDISGNGGNDSVFGGADDDTLFGNEGNDWLYGGDGSDVLTGGEGRDIFYFADSTPGGGDIDIITDYTDEDKIEIDGVAFGSDFLYTMIFGPPFVFDGNNAPPKTPGSDGISFGSVPTFGYSNDGGLYYDRDGTGPLYIFQKFAQIAGAPGFINLQVDGAGRI
jgi:Ca2+-binding RTX toxin-like protein